jgi:hypothetical protein
VKGLLAFYEGNYEAAAQAAAQALAEAPWMYEAQKLLADVAFAQAQRKTELEESKDPREAFLEAIALYEKAAESARSDPRLYEALAEAWEQQARWAKERGRTGPNMLRLALMANDKARQAAPLRASVQLQRAEILSSWASLPGYGSKPLKLAALASAMRAVDRAPREVEAYRKVASIYEDLAREQKFGSEDSDDYWDWAIAWWKGVVSLEPYNMGNDYALESAYLSKGTQQDFGGKDPRKTYAEAEREFNRTELANPGRKADVQWVLLGMLLLKSAAYNAGRGLSPEAEVRRVTQHFQQAAVSQPLGSVGLSLVLRAETIHAQYLIDSGGDPRPQLSRALELIEGMMAAGEPRGTMLLDRADCHYLLAVYANREKRDPSLALAEARQALAESSRSEADCFLCQPMRVNMSVKLSLEEAAWAKRQGQPFLPILQRALAEVPVKWAQEFNDDDKPPLVLAGVYWRLAEAQPPAQARRSVAEGLALVEPVLSNVPESAYFHALQAGLLLVRAQTEREEPQRLETARQAQAALARAFEINPLLRREFAEQVRGVEALLAQAGGITSGH